MVRTSEGNGVLHLVFNFYDFGFGVFDFLLARRSCWCADVHSFPNVWCTRLYGEGKRSLNYVCG